MKKYIAIFLMLYLPLAFASNASSTISNEERQVSFAERVITIELVRSLSPSVRAAKEKCGDKCSDTGALELAIGLMGVSRSDISAKTLVNLLGVRLDGGGAEELSCQMLVRGAGVARYLKQLKPKLVIENCKSVFYDLRKREISGVADVTADQVCNSESEVDSARNEFLQAVTSGMACEQ